MKRLALRAKALAATLILCFAFSAFAQTNGIFVTPAPGEVTQISQFVLTFDGTWALGSKRSAKFKLTGPEGVTIPSLSSYSLGAEGGYCVELADEAVITTPGTYVLTVPACKFEIDGVDNEETSFTFVINSGGETPGDDFPASVIDPAPGSYASISDGFRLTFDTTDDVTVDESKVSVSSAVVDLDISAQAPAGMNYIIVTPVDADGNPAAITSPGNYTLIFGVGAITVGTVSNSQPMVYEYTVTGTQGGAWTGEVTTDPAAGSEVSALKNIDVTFVDANTLVLSDQARPSDFPTLYNKDTDAVVCRGMAYANGNVLEVSLSQNVESPGNYKLVIPKAFLLVDGTKPTADIVVEFVIKGSTATFEYTWTLTPEGGSAIGPDESFAITFAGDQLASVENNPYVWGNAAPHFINAMGAYNPNLQVAALDFTFMLRHEWPFEEEGEYTLVFPAGYFTLTSTDGVVTKNDEITVTYSCVLSGIEDVKAEGTEAPVYFNLQGIQVENPAGGIFIKRQGTKTAKVIK